MKASVDGIYPARQFHLRVEEPIEPEQRKIVEKAIQLPLSGFVDCEFAGRHRIIITSTCDEEESEAMAQRYMEALENLEL